MGLAVASGAIALTCLAALVVVASIKSVDTLSTVALSLAVIAFVAQLIVFVVQAGAANSQMLQSQQLHAQLLALLGEMGERARGTQAAVTTISDTLLTAALDKALVGREGGDAEPVDVRAVASEAAALLQAEIGQRGERSPRPDRGASALDWPVAELRSFPTGDVSDELSILHELTPAARQELLRYGRDAISNPPGSMFPPGFRTVDNASRQELAAYGLTAPLGRWEDTDWGPDWHVLTERGRKAARLLTAEGPPPPAIAEQVAALRNDLS